MIDCDDGEDSDVMDECAAAMVLMRLSCSPHSPRWEGKTEIISFMNDAF